MQLRRHIGYALLTGLAAIALGTAATWNGVNYHYDAAWYLVYARGIQVGEGFSVFITSPTLDTLRASINQWPPLYPMVIALGVGWELLAWARVLSIALLVATGILTYSIALTVTRGSRIQSLLAALLALTAPALLTEGFAYARSETLFTVLALLFLRLILIARPNETPRSVRALLWAAFMVVLLTLTRYVGVAFWVVGMLWAAWWGWRTSAPRRWHPLVAMTLSLVPLGLYALYLRAVSGSLTGTQTTADPLSLDGVIAGVATLTKALLHGLTFGFRAVGLRSNWWGLIAALLIVALYILWARTRPNRLHALFNFNHALIFGTLAGYCVVFWVMGARSQIITEGTERHYVVILPMMAILSVSLLSRIDAPRALVWALTALYLGSGIAATQITAGGVSYNRADWRTDAILAALPQRLPPQTLVHTQYTSLLSYRLGINVPVRTFGSDSSFNELSCDALVYPPPYTHAAFTLIDSAYLRETPAPEVETFMRAWVANCGTVIDYENNGFTMLMVVQLPPRS